MQIILLLCIFVGVQGSNILPKDPLDQALAYVLASQGERCPILRMGDSSRPTKPIGAFPHLQLTMTDLLLNESIERGCKILLLESENLLNNYNAFGNLLASANAIMLQGAPSNDLLHETGLMDKGIFVLEKISEETCHFYMIFNDTEFPIRVMTKDAESPESSQWTSKTLGAPKPKQLTIYQGQTVPIAAIGFPPALFGEEGIYRSGVDMDIVDVLADKLDFKYVIKNQRSWGVLRNNTWSGTMGSVAHGEGLLGIGHISVSRERWLYVDFTTAPYNTGPTYIYTQDAKRSRSLFALQKPFGAYTWLALIITLSLATLLWIILEDKDKWMVPTSVLLGQNVLAGRGNTRVFLFIWLISSFLLLVHYSSSLTAHLVQEEPNQNVDSMADLNRMGKLLYLPRRSYYDILFLASDDNAYQQVYQRTQKMKTFTDPQAGGFFGDAAENAVVQGKGAILMPPFFEINVENLMLKFLGQFTFHRSRLPAFPANKIGFVMKRNCELKTPVDAIIMALVEAGIVSKFQEQYRLQQAQVIIQSNRLLHQRLTYSSLDSSNFVDLLLICSTSACLALAILVVEIKKRQRKQVQNEKHF